MDHTNLRQLRGNLKALAAAVGADRPPTGSGPPALEEGHHAARAVRRNRWTVPVAYDLDGRVGAAYGVEVCPIVELAHKGGIVFRRLIGQHWASAAALEPQVRALLASSG